MVKFLEQRPMLRQQVYYCSSAQVIVITFAVRGGQVQVRGRIRLDKLINLTPFVQMCVLVAKSVPKVNVTGARLKWHCFM